MAGIVGVLTLMLVAGMAANVEMRRKLYPFSATTPIGTVDFVDDQEFRASETVRALVRRDGVEEIFAYPYYASMYLLTETRNATRYQVLLPRYNTDEEIREAIEDLERKKVAYVVVGLALNWNWQDDPVMIYVRSHYDRIPLPTATKARLPSFMLFGRRPAA